MATKRFSMQCEEEWMENTATVWNIGWKGAILRCLPVMSQDTPIGDAGILSWLALAKIHADVKQTPTGSVNHVWNNPCRPVIRPLSAFKVGMASTVLYVPFQQDKAKFLVVYWVGGGIGPWAYEKECTRCTRIRNTVWWLKEYSCWIAFSNHRRKCINGI